MTEKKAIELLMDSYIVDFAGDTDQQRMDLEKFLISVLEELQQYREIGTVEELRARNVAIDIMVKQGIDNCYMAHKYEHPGYEEGMCAGLRTMGGYGEPHENCKECRLIYTYEPDDDAEEPVQV